MVCEYCSGRGYIGDTEECPSCHPNKATPEDNDCEDGHLWSDSMPQHCERCGIYKGDVM